LVQVLRLGISIQARICIELPVEIVEKTEQIGCFRLGEEICRGRDWDGDGRGKEFRDGGVESELEVREGDWG
jgi:hypothetical protein